MWGFHANPMTRLTDKTIKSLGAGRHDDGDGFGLSFPLAALGLGSYGIS
jgi:hypothetical protein